MRRTALAPAKVNLFLHVGPVQADGYHPVASWMVFADLGDRLTLKEADRWSFAIDGPFAAEIGDGENLVERAALRLFDRAGYEPPPARLTLTKRLPVAAGLGGGSSDAGAALRLLNGVLPDPRPESELLAIAAELGADGPACLQARSVLASGRGDILAPAPFTPPLPAVLVNPRRPSSTAAVYRAYDAGPLGGADPPALAAEYASALEVVQDLRGARNDLQAAAIALEPSIGSILQRLGDREETLLARMSGSGATCFALCARQEDSETLAAALRALEPTWWITPCTLSPPITNS